MTTEEALALLNLVSSDPKPTEFNRLDPKELELSARWLLANNEDHVALVAHLLKMIRENDDEQNAIRDGYEFSARFREEQHEAEVDAVHLNIARAIEREARRGSQEAAPNQHLTYEGGLRRAARIARSYLPQRTGS